MSGWAQIIGYLNDLIYVCTPAPLQMGVAFVRFCFAKDDGELAVRALL